MSIKDVIPIDYSTEYTHQYEFRQLLFVLKTNCASEFNRVAINYNDILTTCRDKFGKTLLHHSCELNCDIITDILLSKGAQQMEDIYKKKPIHYAISNNNIDIVYKLKNGQVDTNMIKLARSVQMLNTLFDIPNINYKDSNGNTQLILSAMSGDKARAQVIYTVGNANKTLTNNQGYNAYHYQPTWDFLETVSVYAVEEIETYDLSDSSNTPIFAEEPKYINSNDTDQSQNVSTDSTNNTNNTTDTLQQENNTSDTPQQENNTVQSQNDPSISVDIDQNQNVSSNSTNNTTDTPQQENKELEQEKLNGFEIVSMEPNSSESSENKSTEPITEQKEQKEESKKYFFGMF